MTDISHDPNARLDYAWDWTSWLDAGETITAHTVTASGAGGVTVESSTVIDGKVVAWVSGGTKGKAFLTAHIVTSAGRQDDRSFKLYVEQR